LNLYGFGVADPINFSDPFGLKVCVTGKTSAQLQRAKDAVSDGTDTDIKWDRDNCVESFKARGNRHFRGIQDRFRHMVFSGQVTFDVELGGQLDSPQRIPGRISVYDDSDGLSYPTGPFGSCDGQRSPVTLGQVLAHELIHHAPLVFRNGMEYSERQAIIYGDNAYNRGRGKPPRCRHQY